MDELLDRLQSKQSENHLYSAAAQVIFECVGCGKCCQDEGYALVIDQDIERIAEAKGCTFEEAREAFTNPDPKSRQGLRILKNVGPDNLCIFFDSSNKRCMVYETRPAICRTHPMMNLPGVFNTACPGTSNLVETLRTKNNDLGVRRRIERLKRKKKDSQDLKIKLYIYTLQCQGEDVEEIANRYGIKLPFDEDNFKKKCLAYLLSSNIVKDLEGYEYIGE